MRAAALVGIVALAGCPVDVTPSAPTIRIVAPVEGTFVVGPEVEVIVEVEGAWVVAEPPEEGWPDFAPPLVQVVLILDDREVARGDIERTNLVIRREAVHLLEATLAPVAGDLRVPPHDGVSFAVQLP